MAKHVANFIHLIVKIHTQKSLNGHLIPSKRVAASILILYLNILREREARFISY